jgi:hypothetical protein
MSMIEIQPSAARRRDFAQWAVAQTPKVRTVALNSFAVPAALFAEIPELLLVGALVDGHRYVQQPAELVGVATPDGLAAPTGDPEADAAAMVAAPSPATIHAAMTAALTAADLAAANAASRQDATLTESGGSEREGVFPCLTFSCDRHFTSARGRDLHARQVHPTSGE